MSANSSKADGPYRVEVIADSTGKWIGNGLTFDSVEAARTYGEDLFSRWTAVRTWRVVDNAGTEFGTEFGS